MGKNKPMYAIVGECRGWDDFKEYPWRKIIKYTSDDEFRKNFLEIVKDIDLLQKAGGI